jgi:hypothetical protein
MRLPTLLVVLLVASACETPRRSFHSASGPATPQCSAVFPAAKFTDVVCRGPFPRELLWRAALSRAAETGPDHGALTFDVVETNEAQGWRALRAKFVGAQEPTGQYAIELLLTPAQLEAGRVRATTRTCQRAVITEGTDPQVRATCLQFLSTQQQLAQSERHHAEQLAVQRAQAEAQQQQAEAQQRAAAAAAAQANGTRTSGVSVWGAGSNGGFSGAGGLSVQGAPAPECRMGSDGINTCGYNCRMGSNGRFYCASIPGGQCAFNSNGTWSCP